MNIRNFCNSLLGHPLGALYGTILAVVALVAAVPMFAAGTYDAALVDLVMAGILIVMTLKGFTAINRRWANAAEKWAAWGMLAAVNILALLPGREFPGSLSTAFAFSLLICAFVLFFSGTRMAGLCIMPALWCCVFMPYHEELLLLFSFPLRLSATFLSAAILKLCGSGVVASGTSLTMPGLNIAITDACSGINQLDAFILIAFIAVQILHRKNGWKILHFAFIIPAIIAGNSLRIVITVLLYRLLGERVLQNGWHVSLGYGQILMALLIFLAVGRLFRLEESDVNKEEKS